VSSADTNTPVNGSSSPQRAGDAPVLQLDSGVLEDADAGPHGPPDDSVAHLAQVVRHHEQGRVSDEQAAADRGGRLEGKPARTVTRGRPSTRAVGRGGATVHADILLDWFSF
jgi:hypothetical protein